MFNWYTIKLEHTLSLQLSNTSKLNKLIKIPDIYKNTSVLDCIESSKL